jgi:hypothetical protein
MDRLYNERRRKRRGRNRESSAHDKKRFFVSFDSISFEAVYWRNEKQKKIISIRKTNECCE